MPWRSVDLQEPARQKRRFSKKKAEEIFQQNLPESLSQAEDAYSQSWSL